MLVVMAGAVVRVLGVAMVGVAEASGSGGARVGSASSSFRFAAVSAVAGGLRGMRHGLVNGAVVVAWDDPVLMFRGVRWGPALDSELGAGCDGCVRCVAVVGHACGCWYCFRPPPLPVVPLPCVEQ